MLALGPDEYLEHLRRIKYAVGIPVMASLNGVTPGGWTSYARLLEQAGADGLELHLYHAASDMTLSAADVERQAIEIVREVKRSLRIPVAVKLAPLLTAFAHFAKQLDTAGADGLVLFTRFHRVDIDVDELEVVRTLPLSDSSELPLRLRGAAALAGRVKASLAITGGVHTGLDVIKATMAGAHATQLVSALLRHGPEPSAHRPQEIESWMQEHEWSSLNEMRGNMSLETDSRSRGVRTRELPDGTAMKATIGSTLCGRDRVPRADADVAVAVTRPRTRRAGRAAAVARTGRRSAAPPAATPAQAGYAGSDTCVACHPTRRNRSRARRTRRRRIRARRRRRTAARAATARARRTSTTTPKGTSASSGR